MKVVHITTVHPAVDPRIYEKMCKSAAAAGHEVVLIAPEAVEQACPHVRVVPIARKSSRWLRPLVRGRRALKLALMEHADLYHLHDPELIPVALALRRRRFHAIYDMHENVPAAILDKRWIPASLRVPLSRAWRLAERSCLRRLPVIFAEQSYGRFYGYVSQSAVVQNYPSLGALGAIDCSQRNWSSAVYVGRIAEVRGSTTTLRALAQLKRRRGTAVPTRFIGAADEEHLAELIRMREADNLNVEYTGYLAPTMAWQEAAKSGIGLAILWPIQNYIESYPTKIFEYMALGMAVITSNFPLYRQIVDKFQCGICVDPTDPEAIAAALDTLSRDHSLAREMGERGRRAVRDHFSWEAEAVRLLEFYRKVTERSSGTAS